MIKSPCLHNVPLPHLTFYSIIYQKFTIIINLIVFYRILPVICHDALAHRTIIVKPIELFEGLSIDYHQKYSVKQAKSFHFSVKPENGLPQISVSLCVAVMQKSVACICQTLKVNLTVNRNFQTPFSLRVVTTEIR